MLQSIKTSQLRPNNLTLLGRSSAAVKTTSQTSFSSSRFTMKTLSEERNKNKYLKRIESPYYMHRSGCSLDMSVIETLELVQQQINKATQMRSRNFEKKMSSLSKHFVHHSKISLITGPLKACRLGEKQNVNPQIPRQITDKLKVEPICTYTKQMCLSKENSYRTSSKYSVTDKKKGLTITLRANKR